MSTMLADSLRPGRRRPRCREASIAGPGARSAIALLLAIWAAPAAASREVWALEVVPVMLDYLGVVILKMLVIWALIAVFAAGVLYLLISRSRSQAIRSADARATVVSLHELATTSLAESEESAAARSREQLLDAAALAAGAQPNPAKGDSGAAKRVTVDEDTRTRIAAAAAKLHGRAGEPKDRGSRAPQ